MPKLRITKHDGTHGNHQAELVVIDSPSMSKADCKAQLQLVEDNIVSHHVIHTEDGKRSVTTHKPQAQGHAGIEVDLGWVRLLSDSIDTAAIVAD